MEITMLGTGSPIPDANRAAPAALVKAGDTHILLDAGRGVVMRMTAAGSLPGMLSGVLITQGQDLEGHGLALGTSTALGAAMTARFAKTRAMMPAGGMAIVGLLSAAYHGKKFREWAE